MQIKEKAMKKIIVLLLVAVACFAQVKYETVSFSDTTTSALIDVPNQSYYLAGITKPDSGGDIITFETRLSASDTLTSVLLTQVADSSYTITLPDSTNAYSVSLPRDVFDPWQYFKVKFDKATTVTITLLWKHK